MAEENQEFTELGFRVSKLRVSLKIKNRQAEIPSVEEQVSPPQINPAYRVPVGQLSDSSTDSEPKHFRSRLSSASSITSTDSGIASVCRSRANSNASVGSKTGYILRKIAKAKDATKNAEAEFEGFYRPISRTPSTSSSRSGASSISRTPSSSSKRSSFPSTNPRIRSRSCSSSRNRICSNDSFSDYADLYSTIEELSDPFDDDDEPPPIPPRKAIMRAPALPPYPSTAVSLLNDISKTILC